jgi:hypothetical protein
MALRDLKEQLAEQDTGAEDDDFEIEVIDDRPEEDRREPADLDNIEDDFELSDDEMQALSDKAVRRIKHLTWRAKEEERQRKEAERIRQEAIDHAKKLQQATQAQIRQYQQAVLERQKALSTTQVRDAQAELAVAHEEGDPAKIAEAQAKLTRAINAETQTSQYEQQWTQQGQQAQPENGQGQQDPLQRPPVSNETQEWMQKNPWFNKNRPMTAYAVGVHQDLIVNGVKPDTPEYFDALDKAMRETFPQAFGSNSGGSQRSAAQQGTIMVDTESEAPVGTASHRSRASTPVAPTRGRRSGGSSSSGKVQLTRTEVQTAKALGVSLTEYARQKRALESM